MGRKKSYDRGELIQRAMELFWRGGYEGTSITELSQHLGVNKFGLYAEFGSKQGLFEASLQRYDEIIVNAHFSRLETSTAGLSDISEVLRFFATAPEALPVRLGCLMCNTATERAPLDMASASHVSAFIARLTRALQNALGNAERDGHLRAGTDIPANAALLVTQLLGMFVLRRAQADTVALRLAGEQAQHQIDKLRRD